MIQQTKNVIEKLQAAGLPRSCYRVNTNRLYIMGSKKLYGKAMYEYGDTQITLISPFNKIIPYVKAMAQAGLHVEILLFDNLKSIRVTNEYGKAGLWEHDYTNIDKYGVPKFRRII